jgi:5'-3' exoribonuclease 2
MNSVKIIMDDMGDVEDEILKKRKKNEIEFKEREREKKRSKKMINKWKNDWVKKGKFENKNLGREVRNVKNKRKEE